MTTGDLSRTEALAQHLLRPLPAAMLEKARLHLLDWLGCVAGARRADAARVVRLAEADAVLRAAFLGNVLEMDDVHRTALLHPGPVVWPAALLAVRDSGGDMAELLRGGIAGYEAMVTLGASLDSFHYAHWHNSATAGGFGAAAAAGTILGLSADGLADALGHAGSLAGGLWQMRHEPGMTKQLHIAQMARTGHWHARLAAAGAGAPRRILEGEQGFYAAMTRHPRPFELRPGWRMEEVSFKPWAACRHAHPAIDAALHLRAKGQLSGAVEVVTYRDALLFCDRPRPETPQQAKFSLQHAVAVVLTKGVPEPADFEPTAIERLAAARASVTVVEDEALTAAYPAHFGARLTTAAGSVTLADTLGDPERPLGRAGVIEKALQLMDWGGLAADRARRAVDLVLEGDDPALLLELLEEWP